MRYFLLYGLLYSGVWISISTATDSADWQLDQASATGLTWRIAINPPQPLCKTNGDVVSYSFPGHDIYQRGGEPEVGGMIKPLAGKPGCTGKVKIVSSRFEEFTTMKIRPAETMQHIFIDDQVYRDQWVREPDSKIYGADAFWPEPNVTLDQAMMGTQCVMRLVCHPLRYNPIQEKIRIYRDIVVDIEFHPVRQNKNP